MDPLALVLLILCVVLVGAMWAALASAGPRTERVLAEHDDTP